MYIRYSEELIEEIRISNDIVDVISEYIKLDKKGKNYFGLCPFHKEKTPSFSVEPAKQIFYCFGCGKGGNVFQFVSLAEKLDYIEAVRLLADRARIQLPEGDDEEQQERARQKQEIMKINLLAARYYFDTLCTPQGERARRYLAGRKITEHTARKFGLGYSPERDGLHKFLSGKGYDEKILLKSGLVLPSNSGGLYDKFRGRLMFPIFDVRGNVIGFGGRVMDDSMPKYMNSPETPVYDKGKQLYALNFAKNSGEKRLVVVEGYMDVISLHQSGITNVVATLGTALTESQGRVLKKYSDEIVISYDADTAGQAATIRGLDVLGAIGCNVRVLTVPDGKDPDEYVKKNGPEGFRKLVDSSLSLVEYKIRTIKKEQDTGTLDGRIAFLNKVAVILSKIDNTVEREMYIRKISGEYEISEEAMLAEVLKKLKPRAYGATKPANLAEAAKKVQSTGTTEIDSRVLHDERFVLSLLCVDNSTYRNIKGKLDVGMFTDEENRRIAGIVTERLESGRGIAPAELLNIAAGENSGEFARILNEECHCDDNNRAILGKIRSMENYRTEKRKKQVLELLKDKSRLPEGDVEKLELELKNLMLKIKEHKN